MHRCLGKTERIHQGGPARWQTRLLRKVWWKAQSYGGWFCGRLRSEPHTALGFRHGASDTLASAVPAEIAVHVTGHDLENLSALWKYLNARVALLIPSVLVLSGWPKLPYGQLGDGPVHPSLDGIVQSGVSLHRLDMIIEDLFCFHDGSPPMLLRDGLLRALPRVER